MILEILFFILLIFILLLCIGFVIFIILSFQSEYLGSPFVSNTNKVIEESIKMLQLNSSDIFYDLGSGNGNVLFYVNNKYPNLHRLIGIEAAINPYLISMSRKYFQKNRNNIQIKLKNILDADYSDATAIYAYLLPSLLNKMSVKLKKLKQRNPKLRIVSPVFPIEGMQPEKIHTIYHPTFRKDVNIYLY